MFLAKSWCIDEEWNEICTNSYFIYLKIVGIYVHLARDDAKNIFPAAISGDGRSYNEQVFASCGVKLLFV